MSGSIPLAYCAECLLLAANALEEAVGDEGGDASQLKTEPPTDQPRA